MADELGSGFGIRPDDAGTTVVVRAYGYCGTGQISGVDQRVAMGLAIMLARFARDAGEQWPTPYWDDPWEKAAVDGLRVQNDELSPPQTQQEKSAALEAEFQRAQELLDEALRALAHATNAVDEVRDLIPAE